VYRDTFIGILAAAQLKVTALEIATQLVLNREERERESNEKYEVLS